jgi:WD40 repeat protein
LDPEHGLVDYFDDPVGIVSAMECQDGNNIVTASRSGIQRFDIRCDYNNRIITTFDPGFGRENPVTRLLFDDNILAAAGGNCVRLWDQRYDIIKNGPMLELQHDNVRGLEFCPSRRNVLATGGADGIHFWDVASGDLRSTIPTLLPVTGLTWSPYQNELMTSCGEIMTLWSVAPQVHRLAEWSLGKESGRIFTLDRYTNSPRVVSLHKNGCLAAWNPFGAPPIYREAPLQTPKLRPIDLR